MLITAFCGFVWLLVQIDVSWTQKTSNSGNQIPSNNTGYLIDTEGCRKPYLNVFEPSYMQYFMAEEPFNCNPNNIGSLVRASGNKLHVAHTVSKKYTSGPFTCCYRAFHRKKNSDFESVYSASCQQFNDSTPVSDEFVKVECKDNGGGEIFKEFFSFPRNPYGPSDPEYNNALKNPKKPSVFVFGIDGISRLNFIRQMPKTVKFIEEHGGVSLLGYNKVGYNTFPNLVAALTGLSDEDIKKGCLNNKKEVFDNCTFLWDLFKKEGYVTSYVEDTPWMSTFTYDQAGFKKKPVDYYPRALCLEAENQIASNHRANVNLCLGNKPSHEFYNELMKSFMNTVRNQLTFGFFWSNTLSHDYLNLPRVGDGDYERLFQYLEKIGTFENSVIVLLSDHGMRWGDFHDTMQGYLEDRQPAAYLMFPQWLKKKYSTAMANLMVNSKRLTTPFDLYETLKDLVDLTQISNKQINQKLITKHNQQGISLFRNVPTKRTCKDAGVADDWCTCYTIKPWPTTSEEAKAAADIALQRVNSLVKPHLECAYLKISKIVQTQKQEVPSKESLKFSFQDFDIIFEAKPGNALFEATVRHWWNGAYSVIGAIRRLNMNANQTRCISNAAAKPYCVCF